MSTTTGGPSLDALALHDATLVAVTFGWETATCVADVHGAVHPGWAGARLRWTAVKAFEFARREPWGPSVSILEVTREPEGWDALALQSGDTLRIRAGALEIEAISPAG